MVSIFSSPSRLIPINSIPISFDLPTFSAFRATRRRFTSVSLAFSCLGIGLSCPNRTSHVFAFQREELKPPKRKQDEEVDREMTIKPAVRISERKLIVKDRTVLTDVPDNVIPATGSSSGPVEGVFLGAVFNNESSRQVITLGTLRDVRFMACFRFKLWWMAQKMGDRAQDIPLETQFLLLETKDESPNNGDEENQTVYTVLLPLIEGPFRSCLQGNDQDELELCLESGDEDIKASSFTHSLFIHAGTDPFATITDAVRAVKLHLKTFRQRHEKKLPGIVDYFGWCTWDAFYQEVTQEGVESGLQSLTSGGAPPKFVIIDDGWQSVSQCPIDQSETKQQQDQQSLYRLTRIEENSKFQDKNDPTIGIKNIVDIAKNKFGLKYVYVWHAIIGYWGGVQPGLKELEDYDSSMKFPSISKGVARNEPTWKNDALAVQGLGLMNPKNVYKFYNELHSYLASAGIDGVKVDVQSILETLGAGLGGRVELNRQYHQALDASVARNFPDNGCIACMSHSSDALYCSKQTAVVRASDDFYPRDPVSHTIHIAAVAYNSVFLGEFMEPDWDMFHSLHPAADYHASARAISGGPIYVSDAPGKHNFELLKKLVLPDGSVLRALLPGRPTRDCLFSDPARDGISLLKIWNMNKYTGVLGVYNCQGAAWNSTERKNTFHPTTSDAITGFVRGRDIHLISLAATDPDWSGDCAVYCHQSSELVTLPHNAAIPVSLRVLDFEIYTITPIKILAPGFTFSPLGLIDMFNAGGAIEDYKYNKKDSGEIFDSEAGAENQSLDGVGTVRVDVKGCGRFGAYSSAKPKACKVEGHAVDFSYNSASGLISLTLDELPQEGRKVNVVEIDV